MPIGLELSIQESEPFVPSRELKQESVVLSPMAPVRKAGKSGVCPYGNMPFYGSVVRTLRNALTPATFLPGQILVTMLKK